MYPLPAAITELVVDHPTYQRGSCSGSAGPAGPQSSARLGAVLAPPPRLGQPWVERSVTGAGPGTTWPAKGVTGSRGRNRQSWPRPECPPPRDGRAAPQLLLGAPGPAGRAGAAAAPRALPVPAGPGRAAPGVSNGARPPSQRQLSGPHAAPNPHP